ncbi:winged helix-turn-helix transcriptional regulator [Nocardia sp. SC052]|uniref:winged helix-turn-helix transcriptional regulator n=1 Tax=Nocardia sichangensis TaxID=3385975 RepID=UPI00399F86C9
MHRTSYKDMRCSIGQSLELIGQWWTPLILRDLYLGLHRFDDITENLGISRNLLSDRLDGLLHHGIVERRIYRQRPARYEYHLTSAGLEFVPVLMALMAWGDKWATPPGGPPVQLHHNDCGALFTPRVACSECGEPVSATTVTALPGPGAAPSPGTTVVARRHAELGRSSTGTPAGLENSGGNPAVQSMS